MAKYLLLKDVVVSFHQEAVLFRAGKVVDEATLGVPIHWLELAGSKTVGETLQQIKDPPIIGGLPIVDGTGIDNYNYKVIAEDDQPLELFRVQMPDDDAQSDIDLVLNATAPDGSNGAWKYNLSYARAGGAPALQGSEDPISAKGSDSDAPPAGWVPAFSVVGNAVVISIATDTGVTIYANAQVVRTKGG